MAIPAGRFNCKAHSSIDVGQNPFAISFIERRPGFLNPLNQVVITAYPPKGVSEFRAEDAEPDTLLVI